MTTQEIQSFVVSVDREASRYESAKRYKGPYTVWREKRLLPLMGDNRHMGGIKFQIDRFTKHENDRIAAALLEALEARDDIFFEYQTDYEADTGYIHHIYDCEGI